MKNNHFSHLDECVAWMKSVRVFKPGCMVFGIWKNMPKTIIKRFKNLNNITRLKPTTGELHLGHFNTCLSNN